MVASFYQVWVTNAEVTAGSIGRHRGRKGQWCVGKSACRVVPAVAICGGDGGVSTVLGGEVIVNQSFGNAVAGGGIGLAEQIEGAFVVGRVFQVVLIKLVVIF
jgi:hypothetical protein